MNKSTAAIFIVVATFAFIIFSPALFFVGALFIGAFGALG